MDVEHSEWAEPCHHPGTVRAPGAAAGPAGYPGAGPGGAAPRWGPLTARGPRRGPGTDWRSGPPSCSAGSG